MFNTLTEVLHEIVSIIQVIPSFFVFNKPLEIPSYIPLFSQWDSTTIIPKPITCITMTQRDAVMMVNNYKL